ncbi:hypothetical protein LIER_43924 [Lithospermum erythrorhizon]
MQDIHTLGCGSIGGGGGGRIFTASSVERQIEPQEHQNHLALKCPRCDSENTKFCYYNNYNLSQPRHYCKNCRRYWTKGGVLRNIPVGGGCRKSRRFPKTKSSKIAMNSDENINESSEKNYHSSNNNINYFHSSQNNSHSNENNNYHSSSESSSLPATITMTMATTSNAVGGGGTGSSPNSLLVGEHNAKNASCDYDHCQPLIDQQKGSSEGNMLHITNMVSTSQPEKMMGPIYNVDGDDGGIGGGVEERLFDFSCEDEA